MKKLLIIGYNLPNIICGSAYISSFVAIGNGCVLLNNVVITNSAVVKDNKIIYDGENIRA